MWMMVGEVSVGKIPVGEIPGGEMVVGIGGSPATIGRFLSLSLLLSLFLCLLLITV